MKKNILIIVSVLSFALFAQNDKEVVTEKPQIEEHKVLNTDKQVVAEKLQIEEPKVLKTDKKKGDWYDNKKAELDKKGSDDVMSDNLPYGQLIFAFGFLFIIMGAVLYAIKKWGRKFTGLENEATIKIIARNHIDTKNSLVVARVYEEEVLLGVGANGITLLSRFSPIGEDEIEANNNDNKDSIFDSELKTAIKTNSVSSEELTKP